MPRVGARYPEHRRLLAWNWRSLARDLAAGALVRLGGLGWTLGTGSGETEIRPDLKPCGRFEKR